MEQVLRSIVEEAEQDPRALGVLLFGSQAVGNADEESDFDVLYVQVDGAPVEKRREGRVEVVRTTLTRVREPTAWFKPALAYARVLLDKTGDVTAAVDAAAQVGRDEAAELYDDYLNYFYRSLKAWRRGNELAGRIEAAGSLRSVVDFLFALEGRRAPYPSAYVGRLGGLEPLIFEIARSGDPRLQQQLQARVETLATANGFRDVYDGWEGDIDRAMAFEFA